MLVIMINVGDLKTVIDFLFIHLTFIAKLNEDCKNDIARGGLGYERN